MGVAAAGTVTLPSTASARLDGPDAVRFVAFCAVVVLHALGDTAGKPSLELVGNVARFAVPFFFLLSGYFLSRTANFGVIALRTVRRLVPVFLIWLIIYMLATGDFEAFTHPAQLARYMITGGPAYHLWFLPALGLGIVIVAIARRSRLALIILGISFFLTGLAFGAYRDVLHLPDLPIGTRNGPFFSVPFVALGYLAAQRPIQPLLTGLALLAFGLALQCAESFFLTSGWVSADKSDYYLGTLPFAVGVLVLSLHLGNSLLTGWTAELGRTTLWMYCIHALFLMLLSASMSGVPLIIAAIGSSVLTAAAAGALAQRFPPLVPFVR